MWLSTEAIDLGRPYWILHPVSCHTPEAATTVFNCSWGWTQKASETCTVILQLLINILPSCITLVLYMYYPRLCFDGQSHWPRVLRRWSAAARLLVLRVRIPPGASMSLLGNVCCQVEVTVLGWSLVPRSPTERDMPQCEIKASIMRHWPIRDCCAVGKMLLLLQ